MNFFTKHQYPLIKIQSVNISPNDDLGTTSLPFMSQ